MEGTSAEEVYKGRVVPTETTSLKPLMGVRMTVQLFRVITC
jgi:hypothetical protein